MRPLFFKGEVSESAKHRPAARAGVPACAFKAGGAGGGAEAEGGGSRRKMAAGGAQAAALAAE